jgi:hypothetical protein
MVIRHRRVGVCISGSLGDLLRSIAPEVVGEFLGIDEPWGEGRSLHPLVTARGSEASALFGPNPKHSPQINQLSQVISIVVGYQ